MIEVNRGISGKGSGGDVHSFERVLWIATRDMCTSHGWGERRGRRGAPPPPLEGSVCLFIFNTETRGDWGLYCSYVLARWNLSQLLWKLPLGFFSFFPGENSNVPVVAWSFLSWNKAPNCSDITIQKQVLWQTSFVNLLQRLIDYFSFFN